MNLSQHFTLAEMTFSPTAIKKGINNIKIPFPDGSGYRQGNHTERFINNYRV